MALVLGSEGDGLAPLTRKRCDALAAIPQHGTLSSLNVATAGAVACFEIARQRSGRGRTPATSATSEPPAIAETQATSETSTPFQKATWSRICFAAGVGAG